MLSNVRDSKRTELKRDIHMRAAAMGYNHIMLFKLGENDYSLTGELNNNWNSVTITLAASLEEMLSNLKK